MMLIENNTSVCPENRTVLKGNFPKEGTETLGLLIKSRFKIPQELKEDFQFPQKVLAPENFTLRNRSCSSLADYQS